VKPTSNRPGRRLAHWLAENNYTQDEFRASLRAMLVTARVRDAVTKVLPATVRQVHARHILVSTEPEAKKTLERLQAGEDFAALARELSRDVTSAEQGGDLGWFTQDELLGGAGRWPFTPARTGGGRMHRLGITSSDPEFETDPSPRKTGGLDANSVRKRLQSVLDATIERFGVLAIWDANRSASSTSSVSSL
jgi:hypothetical protein